MALDATLREALLRLTPEEKAEASRLLDASSNDDRREGIAAPNKFSMREWLDEAREVREMFEREGVKIDAVAEVRAVRDEI